MNITMWVLAGGVLGWIGHAFLDYNAKRGLMVAILIGAVGGFFGGNVVAPMFTAASVAGEFSTGALIFAVAAAAAFLAAGNLIYERWDI